MEYISPENPGKYDKNLKTKGTGCFGSTMIIVFLLAIILPIGIWMWRAYNSMVEYDETINQQWSLVQVKYERRYVIVDQLINTVKGVSGFEKSTLTQVIEARSNAMKIDIKTAGNNDSLQYQIQKTQAELTNAVKAFQSQQSNGGFDIKVINERYPDLKAPEAYIKLMNELNSIEMEVADARMSFNNVTKEYNAYIRKFPKNIFASIFGFDKRMYFESTPGAENSHNDASSLAE